MRLNEVEFVGGTPITGYGAGFFRIGEEVVHGPALVLPESYGAWNGIVDLAPLLAAAGQIDVLFVGMGSEIAHPPAAFRDALEAKGIGVEPMSSPAACRTYNVVLGEGRRIGAALLPVD